MQVMRDTWQEQWLLCNIKTVDTSSSVIINSAFANHYRIRKLIHPEGNFNHQLQPLPLHSAIFHTPITTATGHRDVNWQRHRRQFNRHMSSDFDHRLHHLTGSTVINDRHHHLNNGHGYNGHDYYYWPRRHRSHQHISSSKSAHTSASSSSSSASSSSGASAVASDELASRRSRMGYNRFGPFVK